VDVEELNINLAIWHSWIDTDERALNTADSRQHSPGNLPLTQDRSAKNPGSPYNP
jgi:hypothetical protein